MALNLWKTGGKQTSFNPLPLSWNNYVPINIGNYVVTFNAKSASSANLQLTNSGSTDFLQTFTLTPDVKSYTFSFTSKSSQNFFFYDASQRGDIVVDSILLNVKPLSSLTINGIDGFGTKLDGASGSLKSLVTFAGKVSGSNVENVNIFKRSGNNVLPTSPSSNGVENVQSWYDNISTLNGTVQNYGSSSYAFYPQHIFGFNVVKEFEKHIRIIPSVDMAGKVQWLKDNLSSLSVNWYGYGVNTQANPTYTTDFTGKVAGSVVENANKFFHRHTYPRLATPSEEGSIVVEGLTANYQSIISLDGSKMTTGGNVVSGEFPQQVFSFDLIAFIKKNYGVDIPGVTVADKVAWLKTNVSTINFNWWGYGSCPTGNKASISWWNSFASVWSSATSNTASTITKLVRDTNVTSLVDGNGLIYFAVYTDASDGVTPSTVNTDYVSLDVSLFAGGNKATMQFWSNSALTWSTPTSHTNSGVAKINITSSAYLSNFIDANGFLYAVSYSEPSNGISSSTVFTDYVELEITVKQAGVVNSPWTLNGSSQVVDDTTFILTPVSQYQGVELSSIPCLPNTTYTLSASEVSGNSAFLGIWFYDQNKTVITNNNMASNLLSSTFTTPSNCYYISIQCSNRGTSGFTPCTFRNVILNMGTYVLPYEKKRGTRMVMPYSRTNLFNKNVSTWAGKTGGGGATNGTVGLTTYAVDSTYRLSPMYLIPVKSGQIYSISIDNPTIDYAIWGFNSSQLCVIDSGWLGRGKTYTVPSNVTFICFTFKMVDGSLIPISTKDYFNVTMIEGLNTITSYDSFSPLLSKKPFKYVAKKNLFDNYWEQGSIATVDGVGVVATTRIRNGNFVPISGNTQYVVSCQPGYEFVVYFYDASTNYVTSMANAWVRTSFSFTSPVNAKYFKIAIRFNGGTSNILPSEISNILPQLELGTVPSIYEPYQLSLPFANRGISFNGTTDSVLFSNNPTNFNTKGFVEVTFSSKRFTGGYLLGSDANTRLYILGSTNGTTSVIMGTDSSTSIASKVVTDGQKHTIRVDWVNGVFTFVLDGVLVDTKTFGSSTLNTQLRVGGQTYSNGFQSCTVYKFSYGTDNDVRTYDFENARSIVANQVMPGIQNLVPSYEDSRWIINGNAKILGKDFMRLDATGLTQTTDCFIDVLPNTTYNFKIDTPLANSGIVIRKNNGSVTYVASQANDGAIKTFTTDSATTQIYIRLFNYGVGAGAYEFIRPQLYAVSGKEGTISGSPIGQSRHAKRRLYAKR